VAAHANTPAFERHLTAPARAFDPVVAQIVFNALDPAHTQESVVRGIAAVGGTADSSEYVDSAIAKSS
jgi:hypothetical protein